jgi:DNA-binding transcriptional LysR family regulator
MNPIALPTLRYAAAVARLGSFSAAARESGVSQPTVSNAIADLEEALGARLFERSTRKVRMTPAGRVLLPMMHAVLGAVADLEREAQALEAPSRKLLRIGFSQLVGAQRLGMLFEPFGKAHRDVELIYKECSQGDMEGRLEANSVDVVCGTGLGRARNRSRQLLHREALRWVAPNGAAAGDRVSLREVARYRLVLTDGSCGLAPATREIFARARISIDEYAGQAMTYAVLEEWADLGIGGAILPESQIRKARSSALENNAKPLILTYEAVWRKDLLVAQHTKAFVEYLRTVVPGIIKGSASIRSAR